MPTFAGGGGAHTHKAGRVWHGFLKAGLHDLPKALGQCARTRQKIRRLGR